MKLETKKDIIDQKNDHISVCKDAAIPAASADESMPRRVGYSIRGLANWILDFADEVGIDLTNMALNKLAFFAYEAALLRKGIILTNAKIEAWEHGPVFREIYHDFKAWGDKPIRGRCSFYSVDTNAVETPKLVLADEEDQELRNALAPLLRLSASKLRELSHIEGGAWYRVWWHSGYANPGMEIRFQDILETHNPTER